MNLIVGLTGQSGAGKTTACESLVAAGFYVINCDEITHEMLRKKACIDEISDCFGRGILDENGEIVRKELGRIVFADDEKIKKLNQIIHPYILDRVKEDIKEKSEQYHVIVLDAPTLFESGADKLCDITMAVVCDYETLLKRIAIRDKSDRNAAVARLKRQHDEAFFRSHCDIVVENSGEVKSFYQAMDIVVEKIKNILYKN